MSTREYLDLITTQRMKGEITSAEYFNEKQKIDLIETGAIIHENIEPMAVHQIRESNLFKRFEPHKPVKLLVRGRSDGKSIFNQVLEEDIARYRNLAPFLTDDEILELIERDRNNMSIHEEFTELKNKVDNHTKHISTVQSAVIDIQKKINKEPLTTSTPLEFAPNNTASEGLNTVVDHMGNYLEQLTPAINEQLNEAHKHMHETVKKEVTKAQHYNTEKLENHSEQLTRLNHLSSERDRLCYRHYFDSQQSIRNMQHKINSLTVWVWTVGILAVIQLALRLLTIY